MSAVERGLTDQTAEVKTLTCSLKPVSPKRLKLFLCLRFVCFILYVMPNLKKDHFSKKT